MPAFTLGTVGCGAECECSAPPCETNCPAACDPCPIPTHDLFASVGVVGFIPPGCINYEICGITVLSGTDEFGFTNLVFDGVDEWVSPTIVYQAGGLNFLYEPTGPGAEDTCTFEYVFTLKCEAGSITLFADHVGGTCTTWRDPTSFPTAFASGETPIDTTSALLRSCVPFDVDFVYDDSTAAPAAGGYVIDVCPPVNAGCCPVTVTVLDCFGDPISDVYVKVEDDFTNTGGLRADGTTNGSGVVVLDVLQAGTYTVTVASTGFTPAEIALTCEGSYEIEPDECCVVTFTVVDCNGDPISGATVEVFGEGGALVASGTTNGSGVVVLNVGTAGTYDVLVDAEGFTIRELELACDGEYTLEPDPENCGVPCEICVLPTENLNYSYTSSGVGTGTGTMTFDGVDTWESGCITETLSGGPFFFTIALVCTGDVMVASLRHYTASGCATLNTFCASNSSNPTRLVFDSSTDDCDPVYLRWTLDGTTCSFFGGFPAGFSEIEIYE